MTVPRRIVVTGAAGFVGRALCRELVSRGHTVIGLVRQRPGNPLAGVDYVAVDLESADLATLFPAAVEGVVHAAGRAHRPGERHREEAYQRTNTDMALAVARAALHNGVTRFVFISTAGVLGNRTTGQKLDEDSPPAPATPYAHSKLAAEIGLQALFASVPQRLAIIRPPLVYGPHAPGNFGLLARLVRSGMPLPFGNVRNRRSVVALDNLVDLICLCLDHPGAGEAIWLAGDGAPVSTPQIISGLAAGMGRRARLFSAPDRLLYWLARLGGRPMAYEQLTGDLEISSEQTHQRLGWTPRLTTRDALEAAGRALMRR